MALRWLIQGGALPIPGAKNADQATQNAAALSFTLTPTDMHTLSEVTRPFLPDRQRA